MLDNVYLKCVWKVWCMYCLVGNMMGGWDYYRLFVLGIIIVVILVVWYFVVLLIILWGLLWIIIVLCGIWMCEKYKGICNRF